MFFSPEHLRQLKLEEESVTMGIELYAEVRRKSQERRQEAESLPGQRLMSSLAADVSIAVALGVSQSKRGLATKHALAYSYLEVIDPGAVAVIALKCILDGITSKQYLQRVAVAIGTALEEQIGNTRFGKEAPIALRALQRKAKKSSSERYRRAILNHAKAMRNIISGTWPQKDKFAVGQLLINLVIEITGIVEARLVQEGRNNTPLYLFPTAEASSWIEDAHNRTALLSPQLQPMIIPPKPWTTPHSGGYWSKSMRHIKLVKTFNKAYLDELANVEMPDVYTALNAVQAVPWVINKPILEVVKSVWDGGGMLGDLPRRDDVPLPAFPVPEEQLVQFKEDNPEEWGKWKRAAHVVHQNNATERSKRIALSRKLATANKFQDEPNIYFPHNLDFRGRLYPLPLHLHPQGDDVARGLLKFAEAKPLGERGAYWLAIHGANLWGIDKVPFADRVKWTLDNSEKIIDSALDPLDGERFWTTADKPYQALAFAYEWLGYTLEGNSYMSRLPIALDGSCNGLQNFSAMLRDPVGGNSVNLVPNATPQDVYAEVAKRVNVKLIAAAEAGDEVAAQLVGKVNRKLVKRNVMTVPYGARKYGMREQLNEELKTNVYDFAIENYKVAGYLSHIVYDTIGETVVAARQVMDWLQGVARVISADGLPIYWTAPSGLPVVQAYKDMSGERVKVWLGGVLHTVTIQETGRTINKSKQANGIAPNYVHSLDAAHLTATVNLGVENGITTWHMIHDSYGTHACDTDTLAAALRQAFINQYSVDRVEVLMTDLKSQLTETMFKKLPAPPQVGTLDLQQIMQSEYFFA